MTHHMLPGFGLDWMSEARNAFLIRDPEVVLASLRARARRGDARRHRLRAAGEMFEREADRLGEAPPVIEGNDVLARPGHMLRACARRSASPMTRRC